MNTQVMVKVNRLRGLSVSGATTGSLYDDLGIFKHEAENISHELERLLNEFKVYTIYQDDADWDEFHGFTIIAKSEKEARDIAFSTDETYSDKNIWLDKTITKCEIIELSESKLISSDFNRG